MKRTLFLIGIMLCLLTLLAATATSRSVEAPQEPQIHHGEVQVLERILEGSGTAFLEADLYTSLHLPNTLYAMEEMEGMLEVLLDALGIEGEQITVDEVLDEILWAETATEEDLNRIFVTKYEDVGTHQIVATAILPEGMTTLKLYGAAFDEMKESYIIIDTVHNKGYKEIGEILSRNRSVLEQWGENIETTVNLMATRPDKLNESEIGQWVDAMINLAGAEIVEKVIDPGYTSVTLYTPEIPFALQYGNKRVNLQLATGYNNYEQRTYLWIATPLITNTY